MSQEKLRDMVISIEERLNSRLNDHHDEVLRGISDIRTDFRAHVENDRKAHAHFQGQFSTIYKTAATVCLGAFMWAWNYINR